MSIRSEVIAKLRADANITALIGTNSFHGLVPLNFDFTASDAVVFEAHISVAENAIDIKDFADQYTLTVKALSGSAVNMEALAAAIKISIQSYTSSAIQDILLERENYLYDTNNELHILSVDFTVWFFN